MAKEDGRLRQLADLVTGYSLATAPGDKLLVVSESPFQDFVRHISDSASERGARLIYDIYDIEARKRMIERGDKKELKAEGKRTCDLLENAGKVVVVDSESKPHIMEGVDDEKMAAYEKYVQGPFVNMLDAPVKGTTEKRPNVLVAVPCEAEARKAGMSLGEYTDFLYNACLIDWTKTSEKMRRVKARFDNAKDVRVYVPNQTDLHLSLQGRGGEVCDGKENLPDGEVCYGPVENSLEGVFYSPYPTVRNGKEVSGIRLTFRKGKVVEARADKNQRFLEEMIGLRGGNRVGELGIGCNPGITRYMKSLLFDEKIGGTVHVAMGYSYPQPLDNGGGLNESDIHWDFVCDLRPINGLPGGELYIDNQLVQKNGVWRFE